MQVFSVPDIIEKGRLIWISRRSILLAKRTFVISIQHQGIAEMGVAACNPRFLTDRVNDRGLLTVC